LSNSADGYLSEADFRQAIASVPLVSVDLLLVHKGHLLLGRRRDEPARDTWFVPGGRIRRGEAIADAMRRVWNAEVVGEMPAAPPRLLGAYEHFYDCAFDGSEVATHYVVLAYRFDLAEKAKLQPRSHDDAWWAPIENCSKAHNGVRVHPHAMAYVRELVAHVKSCVR
jgi:colanic acid biosynthesis protein WcaH